MVLAGRGNVGVAIYFVAWIGLVRRWWVVRVEEQTYQSVRLWVPEVRGSVGLSSVESRIAGGRRLHCAAGHAV